MSGPVHTALLWPLFVMAGLTFAVWCRMLVVRIGQMKRERIHPQAVATSAQAVARLTDSRVADNFRNLFELPVLFYAGILAAHATGQDSALMLDVAWAFVALRIVHSFIQCTYNKVMHRFYAYAAGGVALWVFLGLLAMELMRGQ